MEKLLVDVDIIVMYDTMNVMSSNILSHGT